jgi:ABC-type uncharacterized transport system substrate-binding protein
MKILRRVALVASIPIVALSPFAAQSQPAGKAFRIGNLIVPPAPPPDTWPSRPIPDRLRELGYVEGRDFTVEYRFANGNYDRLPELAAELVRARVDLIVVTGNKGAQAVATATQTIPIVSVSCDAFTVVTSLARHGGNLTGVTCMRIELTGKRLEILKEVVPKVSRVGLLFNPIEGPEALEFAMTDAARLKMKLMPFAVRTPNDVDSALESMTHQLPDALFVNPDAILVTRPRQIADFALRYRLPAIAPFSEFADAGLLLSYGSTTAELNARMVALVEKIFTGDKASNLPVEQATRFRLTVNLKTAKELRLSVPQSILRRADRVIE